MVSIENLLISYPLLAPLIFILIRSVPIIIPPIPGIFLDVIALAVFGWQLGLIYSLAGIMLGASAAFGISRYAREDISGKFTKMQKIHDWEKEVSEHKKFWSLLLLRIPTFTAFDFICYASGLTKIKFITFFFATLLGTIPAAFAFYYFGDLALANGAIGIAAFLAALLVIYLIIKYKKK